MAKGLLGEKIGMTQVFESNALLPVTALALGPCYVTQVKNVEKDGYSAVQIAYKEKRKKLFSKPQAAHQKKALGEKDVCYRYLKEIRDFSEDKKAGDIISCEIFSQGEKVVVQSVSKGKGFQGVVKRYNFGGGRETHGSTFHRSTGAIGAGTYPGEVKKGKKMPGRMGGKKTAIKNVEIVKIVPEENIILVKGSIPGHPGSLVYLYTK
ncbi:MAG: 50S ribosomal protein L3 [Spirochaetia bacterium]|nr:50S ribosomal protein L3 [Spirochaetia bacterium]